MFENIINFFKKIKKNEEKHQIQKKQQKKDYI